MFKGFNQVLTYIDGLGIVRKTIHVEKGKITKISDEIDPTLVHLPEGQIVVPGFIDKHIHGANHSDGMYPTPKDIQNIAKTIASEGVTSFLVTTMTQSKEKIAEALANIGRYIEEENQEGAQAIGIHLEGPFICTKYKGAQPEEFIVPCDVETFQFYQKASRNHIKQVTLAYEENGKELVHYLTSQGIVASIGHTNATSDETLEGIKEGITSATHTFNAMKGIHHREIGTAGAVLLSDEIYCELIADLVHVSNNAIKLLYKCKGKEKVIAITDAIESKHLPDGTYHLGGQEVIVKDHEARLHDGTLAGSTLQMHHGLKNLKDVLGLSIEDIVDFATKNPAINLNVFTQKGSIAVGKDADFAVINQDFNVFMTINRGKIIFQK
ncbi:MAG: N-acetylglucosamine-6-phosphate deacetylase [Bacilli bacterium]|jgi:N-acetylglucosamine-6-phosphate deacetylase|nr:N-acetylglucosamine-6-phosphate deacetylase [Bacilli bacterium]MDY0063955.1 N-acetylglucosamine-6-phosphate deacetylase [Bacilli bacterium]